MVLISSQKYGASIRKQVEAALYRKKALYPCPRCGKKKVKRNMMAVWKCRSCEGTFAGAAYSLTSEAGEVAFRLIQEYKKL